MRAWLPRSVRSAASIPPDPRSALARRRWDLERFGITPAGLNARLRPPEPAPRILSISIPKAGTHLVERALCLHPLLRRRLVGTIYSNQVSRLQPLLSRQRRGELLCAHLRHRPEVIAAVEAHRPRVLLVIRDPRDIVVSRAHYGLVSKKPAAHRVASRLPRLRDRLTLCIRGDEAHGIPSMAKILAGYAPWLHEPGVRILRFEDLVDPERRPEEIGALYEDLGIPLERDRVDAIAAGLVSPVSTTFRSGVAGEWTDALDEDLLELLEDSAGELLSLYGYG